MRTLFVWRRWMIRHDAWEGILTMKQWLNKIRMWFKKSMEGRNGQDELGVAVITAGAVIYLLGLAFRNIYFVSASMLTFGYGLFRCFSRNIWKRRSENNAFCEMLRRVKRYGILLKLQWRDRKTYRYFMCSKCGQLIRMPKLKKKVEIKCPKCGNRFVRKL